jgi:hypothetical protein
MIHEIKAKKAKLIHQNKVVTINTHNCEANAAGIKAIVIISSDAIRVA